MTEPGLIAIDLTDDERDFMQTALTEFGGTASYKPFPIKILGVSTDDEFEDLLDGSEWPSRGDTRFLNWTGRVHSCLPRCVGEAT